MSDCIFCRIIKGDLPSYKVYEDDSYFAFLEINPLNPGHTMVVPKDHYRWVWDVDDISGYYEVVKKLANAIKSAFGTDYVVSVVMGNDVPHAHVHLIPRLPDDGHGGGIDIKNVKKYSKEEFERFAALIRDSL